MEDRKLAPGTRIRLKDYDGLFNAEADPRGIDHITQHAGGRTHRVQECSARNGMWTITLPLANPTRFHPDLPENTLPVSWFDIV